MDGISSQAVAVRDGCCDGNVTLNVEVVPGLYYAADSAATIGALKRPGAAEPAKAGDAVVAPKQSGTQGFYKVWVSDAPPPGSAGWPIFWYNYHIVIQIRG